MHTGFWWGDNVNEISSFTEFQHIHTHTYIYIYIHPCNQNFIYSPTDAPVSCLKKNNIKIYIGIYIKRTPTCFGVTVTPSSESALIVAY